MSDKYEQHYSYDGFQMTKNTRGLGIKVGPMRIVQSLISYDGAHMEIFFVSIFILASSMDKLFMQNNRLNIIIKTIKT